MTRRIIDPAIIGYGSSRGAVRWIPFVNKSGETIPSFGLIALANESQFGRTNDGMRIAYKPSAIHESLQNPALHAFNDEKPVPPNGKGNCTSDFPAMALHDGTSDSLGPGAPCGPKANSWYVWSTGRAFLIEDHDPTFAVKSGSGAQWDNLHSIWVGCHNSFTFPGTGIVWQTSSSSTPLATGECLFKNLIFDSETSIRFPGQVVLGTNVVDGFTVTDGGIFLSRAGWYNGTVSATVRRTVQGGTHGLYMTIERPPESEELTKFLAWRKQQDEIDEYGNVVVEGYENICFPFLVWSGSNVATPALSSLGDPYCVLRVRNNVSDTEVYNTIIQINFQGQDLGITGE